MPPAPAVSNSEAPSAVSFKENALDDAPVQGQSTITDRAQADAPPATTAYQPDALTTGSAGPATFTPMRVLLLVPAALALTGVLAFAIVPSRLQRNIYARRRRSNSDAMAEPNLPAPPIDMPHELKQNLRQVLQTLEAQLRGEMEFEQDARAQRRSTKVISSVG
jgi:hypothetical protein